eukprot:869812-Pyramimonas_sp.AAC.1
MSAAQWLVEGETAIAVPTSRSRGCAGTSLAEGAASRRSSSCSRPTALRQCGEIGPSQEPVPCWRGALVRRRPRADGPGPVGRAGPEDRQVQQGAREGVAQLGRQEHGGRRSGGALLHQATSGT